MTGWRIGYVAGPKTFIDEIAKVHSHSVTHATSFAMAGGVAALNGPQEFIGEMVEAWDRRRRNVAAGLNAIRGINCPLVEGAFYAFPDISGTGLSGAELADRLLHEAGVCVLAGTAFGGVATGHIRVSYANSRENLRKALERIEGFVSSLPAGATAGAGSSR
jgi:aspartate aminotransferase